MNDVVHSSLIEPYMIAALSEVPGQYLHAKEFDLRNKSSNAITLPTETSWWGSPNDDGTGVDTEFGATEGTDLSNTQVSTGVVTLTCAEYGVALEVTDTLQEDAVEGIDLLNMLDSRMAHVLSLALEKDFLDLFLSLSNTVGSTGVDLTLANMLAAQVGIRVRGANADALVYTLDNDAAGHVESAFTATSTSAASYAQAADRILSYQPAGGHGLTNRMIAGFRGFPVFTTGLSSTLNTAADVISACYVPSSAYNDAVGHVTFGMGWKRLPRFEADRTAIGRANILVMTCRAGFVEMQDGSGTGIVADKET